MDEITAATQLIGETQKLDARFLSGLLLVCLMLTLSLLTRLKIKLIDQKIITNQNDITKLQSDFDECNRLYSRNHNGVERMVAETELHIQKLQIDFTTSQSVQTARIDRTDKDINKLDDRLSKIEVTLAENHKQLSEGVTELAKNVAVIASKLD